MSILEAIVLGVIQGITEFIPVSSSGHLLITHEIFNNASNSLAFDVALHVGTLLALLLYFKGDLLDLAKNIKSKNKQGRLARLLIIATIPAALAGLMLGGYIDDNLRTPFIVAITLAFGGVLMIIIDVISGNKEPKEVNTKQGLSIGFAQMLALVPGVSRSGVTITTGMLVGLGREQAARFSFLLAVPIIAGSALGVLVGGTSEVTVGEAQIIAGIIAAFISGLLSIKFLLGIIERVGLTPFGIYRIILAVIVVILLV